MRDAAARNDADRIAEELGVLLEVCKWHEIDTTHFNLSDIADIVDTNKEHIRRLDWQAKASMRAKLHALLKELTD